MTELEKFEVFMKNYQDMVYSTAVRLLGNETDAQDIAQTVFMKAYQSFDAISGSPTAGGWLKTVATNLCLNHLTRYRARWRFFSEMRSEDDEPEFLESVPAPNSFQQGMEDADHRRLLEAALLKLPRSQRVPLVLFHFEEVPYEEIAERLGISLSKVKTDIHRGRLSLKRYLKPSMSDDERFQERSSTQNPTSIH
jgi:RNA polymerase sigma-70 factor (ECF subfamily)